MSDSYQIDVLHYLNPHLIWVEVINPPNAEPDEFIFEQIGVYGILPQEITISDDVLSLQTKKCEAWAPTTVLSMNNLFKEATEVWFSPVHIDRRNSLFDNNIHKYGEITVKKQNGKCKLLSKLLIKSGFALNDPCMFLQELSLGMLRTNLTNIQRDEVIKHLTQPNKNKPSKDREKSVKRQTHILQIAKNLESPLTIQNLQRHNQNLDVKYMVKNKIKDLEKCKDVDEKSLGRGVTHKQPEPMQRSSLLRKKLEMSAHVPRHHKQDPASILLATKKFLEANAKIKEDVTSGSSPREPEDTVSEAEDHTGNIEEYKEHSSVKSDENECANKISNMKKTKNANKNSKYKVPEYDMNMEQCVAYGPPGLNPQKLPLKIVPKTSNEVNIVKTLENNEEIEGNYDIHDGLDSAVNVEITNKDQLTLINKDHDEQLETSSAADVKVEGNVDEKDAKSFSEESNIEPSKSVRSKILLKKLRLYKGRISIDSLSLSSDIGKDSSSVTEEDSTKGNGKVTPDSDEESIQNLVDKLALEYGDDKKNSSCNSTNELKQPIVTNQQNVVLNNNVNPFKNVDPNIPVLSVFVEKLVMPVLMVHSKTNKRIQPRLNLRDVCFNNHIHAVLKNMSVEKPMMLQTVSWYAILRGYSLFMISSLGSGKTLGYVPAICRLVSDSRANTSDSVGPSCIIVCATAKSVSEVEKLCRMFLGIEERVVSCYAGMDELYITSSLLNGCDLFICTPSALVRLLQMTDFGLDLSRLSTFVLEDAERLLEVYLNEVKFFLIKIKEMLKNRANKEMKVQFVVASRIWCDFMESLAKKAPHSVVCIGSFQECVLYSKASTTVNFVKKENKVKTVLEFLEQIVNSKKTVIVCRSNDEVELLEKNLKKHGKIVFGCDNTMTVHDLYDLSKQWNDYEEPLLGPILVCCDGNLTHLNVSDAHYLVHYSLPEMFSMFCKRFSVLNDNYPSIFKTENKNIKIKILLDDSNVEQLPKILNFIKRCTNDVPTFLDEICAKVIEEKDIVKAKKFLPVCDSLLALGECPDFWNCIERHAIFKEYDEPKDWMPKTGIITFKILHVQTAVAYSARLLSNVTKNNTTKYPQTYSTLSLKMGMYYSKESNRQLHGIPKVGDLSAVSIKLNFFARCQVVKILNYYKNGNPNYVLIKLIDEEKLERSRDIYLYYLPEDLRGIETHVVQVRLANVKPKDKDVTFSDLSKEQLKKITEKQEHYMRGTVTLAIGNCVFVDTLEACQDLTSLNETVVTDNFKKTLLDVHAIPNPDHIPKLETLCAAGGLDRKLEEPVAEIVSPLKERPPPRWAHLDTDEMSSVLFGSAENPATFFVRLVKFEDCINLLLKDIEKYVVENPEPVTEVTKGDIVLAKFPDDSTYERARIEEVYNNNRVKSFFVDQGDWRDVPMNELITIPEKFITKLPFQAIECRLIGVKPAGDDWTEFGTNWFCDNCFEDNNGHIKQLYIKYFTKESPQFTGGHKYGVVLIDTNGDDDVLINQLMIDVNLAKENEDELKYFDELKKSADFKKDSQSITSEDDWEKITIPDVKETSKVPLEDFFPKKPIRSVHLVQDSDEDSDQWDINMSSDFASLFKQNDTHKQIKEAEDNVVVNLEKEKEMSEPPKSKALETIEIPKNCDTQVACKNVLKSIKQNTKSQNDKSEIQELDSDDFSSTKDSQVSDIADTTLFNTDTEILSDTSKRPLIIEIDNLRKPKVVWRQNNMIVIIKIQLIGVENYDLEIGKRFMKFFAINDDTKYGFEFELYGVVNDKNYSHSNKGQYILIHLTKVMKKTWLTLTRDGGIKKWIVYDVDSIDTSSDEEEPEDDTTANVIKNIHNQGDTDSDDDLLDDINFKYGRH
ncbi:putative ATP-dependent RNA helicase TDRD12 isoform X1 [Galleria mellonella]|uniref:RNA helicase n=1 Tax=Galleria mellonella TaxID=7137 RepID=A0ABM3N0M6_GALME|nr:putative ATP-dependent RNA helicase TDRD12 isoform X1 [Galleria mellonella]XP_052757079.1 putative ATP-dependent RNA helicase TDRD12 isoform X1 [Galleria mellonella]XP_052757080.1 putative ATP-dependent RNA helicase TDRD12 isoform X1 [Galleria mellonella]